MKLSDLNKSEKLKEPKVKGLTINMPKTLHTRLKIVSAKTGIPMGDIVCRCLEKSLHEYERKNE